MGFPVNDDGIFISLVFGDERLDFYWFWIWEFDSIVLQLQVFYFDIGENKRGRFLKVIELPFSFFGKRDLFS